MERHETVHYCPPVWFDKMLTICAVSVTAVLPKVFRNLYWLILTSVLNIGERTWPSYNHWLNLVMYLLPTLIIQQLWRATQDIIIWFLTGLYVVYYAVFSISDYIRWQQPLLLFACYLLNLPDFNRNHSWFLLWVTFSTNFMQMWIS